MSLKIYSFPRQLLRYLPPGLQLAKKRGRMARLVELSLWGLESLLQMLRPLRLPQ